MAQYGGGVPPAGGLIVLPAVGVAIHLSWMIFGAVLLIGGLILVRLAMVERESPA